MLPPQHQPRIAMLSVAGNFHCRRWAKALVRAGAAVRVFSLFPAEIGKGVEVQHIRPVLPMESPLRYLNFALTAGRLHRALRAYKADVLMPLHLTPYGTWALQSGYPAPIVAVAMGADVLEYDYEHPFRAPATGWELRANRANLALGLRRAWFRSAVQRVCDAATLVTADNYALLAVLARQFEVPAGRRMLLRWGVDRHKFDAPTAEAPIPELSEKLATTATRRLILSPRGLRPVYNAGPILESFRQVAPQLPAYAFVVLGAGYSSDPTQLNQARRLAADLPNFFLLERQLSEAEMIWLWRRCRLFLSLPVYDGYSMALAEGRYAGALPLLNPIPGNCEVASPGVHALFLRDESPKPDELSELIQRAVALPEAAYQRYREANREWVAQHSELNHSAQILVKQLKERVIP